MLLEIPPCWGIRIPESGKFLLVESGIGENLTRWRGILGFGIQNTAQGISESPTRLESRIQVLLTKTGVQYLQSGIHCMESRIQDCPGFRYGASLGLLPRGTNLTPEGGGTRPIFGYGWAAEGLKPWPCLGQKILEIHILFRKTSSILVPCLRQLPQFYY